MCKLLRMLLVVFAFATLSSALDIFAAHGPKPVSRARADQNLKSVDLSGAYEGRVSIRVKPRSPYLMKDRRVKLEITTDGRFTLTPLPKDPPRADESAGKPLTGKIETWLKPDLNNRPVGWIYLENVPKRFEIRWYRSEDHTILKLVRAKGERPRDLRFCSATLTDTQCTGRIE